MTLLWTPVPIEAVLKGVEAHGSGLREIQLSGVTMVISPAGDGWGRIERIISPNPQDYMKAEWQPGSVIPLPGATVEPQEASPTPSK